MFGSVVTTGVLAVSCIYDIKNKRIPVWILLTGGVLALIGLLVEGFLLGWAGALVSGGIALLPGAGLLALSFLTEKKVGVGDGLLLMVIGLAEGGEKVLLVFGTGLFLQSLVAVVLLLLKKAKKQTQIPFAPFLLAARMMLFFL